MRYCRCVLTPRCAHTHARTRIHATTGNTVQVREVRDPHVLVEVRHPHAEEQDYDHDRSRWIVGDTSTMSGDTPRADAGAPSSLAHTTPRQADVDEELNAQLNAAETKMEDAKKALRIAERADVDKDENLPALVRAVHAHQEQRVSKGKGEETESEVQRMEKFAVEEQRKSDGDYLVSLSPSPPPPLPPSLPLSPCLSLPLPPLPAPLAPPSMVLSLLVLLSRFLPLPLPAPSFLVHDTCVHVFLWRTHGCARMCVCVNTMRSRAKCTHARYTHTHTHTHTHTRGNARA
jgi:hypothetical protein